jgi:hypothetical protein
MAFDTAFYLVSKDIALRSGLIDSRYRTQDGRYILDNKDLSRVRFTTDEYISGLKGVEKITETHASTLIAKGGFNKGVTEDVLEAPLPEEEQPQGSDIEQKENNDKEEEE